MTKVVSDSLEVQLPVEDTLRGILSSLGGLSKLIRPGNVAMIKPNFVAPFPYTVTSCGILEAIA